ncbi:hypothetical protein niasHT_036336 [Heterodera trifolii]|uniref:Integrase catalytic domain-containing protein n=1 Tax=Heterodera trifolii TaxID=157864 RepID=A0ABD2I1Z7_9BILA
MLTSPQFHAGMAERANRSIKERLYRYFTERGTYKWIEVVQDIVKGINYSLNSSIGMRPADVNFGNAEELRQKLYNEAKKIPKMNPKFKVGDRVTRQIHSGFVYHENYNSNSEWEVGLAVIVYPHTWPSIGTVEQQFVEVEWQTGNTVRIEVPPSNVTNPIDLEALLTDIETMVDLFGVTQGLLAREKRAETSKIPLRIGPDLDVLEEMIRAKLNEEIKNMVEEDRTILDATKEMGMAAWVQAYRKV